MSGFSLWGLFVCNLSDLCVGIGVLCPPLGLPLTQSLGLSNLTYRLFSFTCRLNALPRHLRLPVLGRVDLPDSRRVFDRGATPRQIMGHPTWPTLTGYLYRSGRVSRCVMNSKSEGFIT